MSNKGNQVLSGANGTVWVNGEEWAEVTGLNATVTGIFEEARFCNDYNTYQVYMGQNGEGTLTITNKISSRGAKVLADAYNTGIMPDLKILSKVENKSNGKSERVVLHNVTFTSFSHSFENGSVVNEELPFKFSHPTYLELI